MRAPTTGCKSKVSLSSAAAGDVVHVESHRPQKVPRPAQAAEFLVIQQVQRAGHDLVRRVVPERGANHPIQRLQVSQAAAAFLDVGLDQEGAFTETAVAFVALRLLGG